MNDNKKRKLLQFSIPLLLIMILAAVGWYLLSEETEEDTTALAISLESGFYTEDLQIEVNVPKGMTVFYTNNCEEPNRENGQEYSQPISIVASDEEAVYVYRFKAFDKDGNASEVITKTYFVGSNIDTRYTTNVLNVVGEPEELFGYEEGIFARGKLFDEFIKENPNAFFGGGVEANFHWRGREYEREVYIEYFSEDGTRLFEVNGGIRVHGAATRMKNQKSFRLYARKEYDEQNEFEYPVVSKLLSQSDGTIAQKYKRLLVRNAGNDNGFAFIRSELVAELASQAGFPDVMHTEPVCVYMNGMYQGIYWIGNTFDAQYFENRYGEYTGEFVTLEGTNTLKADDEDPNVQAYVDEYNQLYQKYAHMDLTIDENYQELCKFLDVENYLEYYAIQNYVGNVDWPGNNVKVYRYIAEDGVYTENSVFDGRYRHLLYDVDFGFGLLLLGGGVSVEHRTLEMNMQAGSELFVQIVQREDCRNYFVNYMCDLMNGAMSAQNVTKTLEEKHLSRFEELYYMLQETDIMKDSLWNWEPASIYYDTVEENYNQILDFAERRQQVMLSDMIYSFSYDAAEAYTLYLHKSGLSDVQINSINVTDGDFTGVYFGNVPIFLSPNLAKNEVFDHWIVNGEIREEKLLTLTTADIKEYQIQVELQTHAVEEPVLQIQAVRAKGNGDYIELINLSDKVVSTQGYFMSDSEDEYKYSLPDMILAPGEKKRFYGKDCTDPEGLGQLGLNFNLKQGEVVTLTFEETILETLIIPDLSENGVYERVGISEKFEEVF